MNAKLMKKLCIGSANFGQKYSFNKNLQLAQNEVFSILSLARKHNINTIDTAINYGISEKILGDFGIINWDVITKIPTISDF